ncbi:hypothetical protein JCM30760_19520 [Thiomicrorhabdus hydrogeniphila]
MQILSGESELWQQQNLTIPIRVTTNALHNVLFETHINRIVPLTNEFINLDGTGLYHPEPAMDIQLNLNTLYLPENLLLTHPIAAQEENRRERLLNLEKFLKAINLSENHMLSIITWLVSTLIPMKNFTALELTGESGSGKTNAQQKLRELVDPSSIPISPPPNNKKDIHQLTMKGHVLSIDNVTSLKPEIQGLLSSLLSTSGIEVPFPNDYKEFNGIILVHRPVILNSIYSVITERVLYEKTLTIELPPIDTIKKTAISEQDFTNAQIELFQLASATTEMMKNIDPSSYPLYRNSQIQSFWETGLVICKVLNLPNSEFINGLNQLEQDRVSAQLEESPTAQAILKWAEKHPNKDTSQTVKDWHNTLMKFHDRSWGSWPVSARQTGVEFKKYSSLLKRFGIKFTSLGKRGSFVQWAISTPDKINFENDAITYKEIEIPNAYNI